MSVRIFTGLLAAISFFISSAVWSFDFDFPNDGIPGSGSPAFINNVTINMNDNGSQNGEGRLSIKGRLDFQFDNSSSFLPAEKAIFKLLAFYDDAGTLLPGATVSIKGGIPSLGIPKGTQLMTANIDKWNLLDDPNLWAFGTNSIVCSPLLLVTCTTNESVYVSLLGDGFDGDFNNGKFLASGFAVTTVPVPAAAWLFGSALGMLGWVRSRSRRNSAAA